MALTDSPLTAGDIQKEFAVTITVDTEVAEALPSHSNTPDDLVTSVERTSPGSTPAPDTPSSEGSTKEKPRRAPAKTPAGKKTKTLELTPQTHRNSRRRMARRTQAGSHLPSP
jgi:hypothetical protein